MSKPQTAGRSGLPNSLQLRSGDRCMQGMPAGLPLGMPGIGEEIEITIQQAAHPIRQSMDVTLLTYFFIITIQQIVCAVDVLACPSPYTVYFSRLNPTIRSRIDG